MDITEPLVDASDLADFPGAPFTPSQVKAAADQIRDECGWHIAPQLTQTLALDSDGGRLLALPTLHLVEVTAVRDMTGTAPNVLDGWRKSRIGLLERTAGVWPQGLEAVEVTIVHGYEACPAALLPAIAARCQRFNKDGTVRQESLGSRSVSFGIIEGGDVSAALARYRLGPSS